MKLRARRYWLSFLALTFLAALAANPALTLAYTSYQASAGFSASQGSNQWYYQKWDGSSYTNLTNYDSGAWKGETYLFVEDDTQHPDASDSVRTWIAPSSGIVVITGNVAKEDTSGPSNLSDGVNAKILLNSTELYNRDIAYNDGDGHDVDITVLVNQGDALYFRVNKRGTVWYDETRWNPTVTYVQSTFDAVDDFSGTQGSSQWYYQKWDGSSYT
ncbi:MAG TPA: hypothetical protein VEZ72_07760, partial [Paenibacillus sp.]|nr:hypothetical protein [Paenibacillus sp.]